MAAILHPWFQGCNTTVYLFIHVTRWEWDAISRGRDITLPRPCWVPNHSSLCWDALGAKKVLISLGTCTFRGLPLYQYNADSFSLIPFVCVSKLLFESLVWNQNSNIKSSSLHLFIYTTTTVPHHIGSCKALNFELWDTTEDFYD